MKRLRGRLNWKMKESRKGIVLSGIIRMLDFIMNR